MNSDYAKVANQEHNEFLAISLSNLTNIQLPAAHSSEPNRWNRFDYAVIARMTLHSRRNGFFGRTYQSSHIQLDSNTLKPVGDKINEFAIFYSKFKDPDLHAVVEFVLVITEKAAPKPNAASQNIPSAASLAKEEEKKNSSPPTDGKSAALQPKKILGIGFSVIPLFTEAKANQP